MQKVYIINAGKSFAHSSGKLNATLTEVARELLVTKGHEVKVINIDNGYEVKAEIQNLLWADVIIYQQPAW